ncbi:TetR/AcrR family transcriptional regulator [Planomonospora venezuelensis]|uniref:AcrR family transcriptional regulator n=1 Tax=Planomonospora venezuelensis TaxID=1999 RepID=A0A841CRL3_PLAVE|nr:TetR/AcrR family transcriptional regulator [Planomonospora venezuelensis]MBB5961082.1 AcrR family transcriptional regulator [Planomonospora venezuelensis]GIN04749.1 TetR family transcriptional regulator [Planomonospora venezuelensis]
MTSPPVASERQRDADRTRAEILEVAQREFARRGYAGARVDEIAELMRTTKRMIYYYFGSKERLYIAVLEKAYTEVREAERLVDVEHLAPVEAIRTLAELTFDHHDAHREFIKLVAIENIHRAEHIRKSEVLANLGTPVLDLIGRILDAGTASGDFATEADAIDVHMMISSFCFFRVSNQHTFGALFGRDMTAPEHRARLRRMVGETVVAYLRGAGSPERPPR